MKQMKQMSQKARNLTSSAAVMVVSAYWFFGAAEFRPLSRLFPKVLAAIVFVLALILGVITLLGRGPQIRLSRGDSGERHMRAGTLLMALVLWTLLIPVAGLLIASVLGTLVMGVVTFRAHVGTIRAILIALVSVGAFYLLFSLLLNVPFPRGML